jgi:hypothetical protein
VKPSFSSPWFVAAGALERIRRGWNRGRKRSAGTLELLSKANSRTVLARLMQTPLILL